MKRLFMMGLAVMSLAFYLVADDTVSPATFTTETNILAITREDQSNALKTKALRHEVTLSDVLQVLTTYSAVDKEAFLSFAHQLGATGTVTLVNGKTFVWHIEPDYAAVITDDQGAKVFLLKPAPSRVPEDTTRKLAESDGPLAAHRKWQAEHPEAMKRLEAMRKWKEEHPEAMKEIAAFNLRYAVLVKTQEGKTEALGWFKAHRRLWEGTPLEAETLQEIKRLESEGK